MAYVPIAITDSTPLTGQLMNFVETQYAQAKLDIDLHTHDTSYYPKATADIRFFQGGATKPDADTIDDLHWNEIVGNLLPVGSVVGWNGTDENVPTRWHICDGGTYSGTVTPDMRGKFPLGAGRNYAAHSTGGRASISDAGGTVTVSDHMLTVSEIPGHYHNWTDTWAIEPGGQGQYGSNWTYGGSTQVGSPNLTTRTGTTDYNHSANDEAHNHGTNAITLNSFNIIPLYVAKYFICKVS